MKTFLLHILMIVLPVCMTASINNQPEIKLDQAKDRVISAKLRISILEVVEKSLNRSDDTFIAVIGKVKSPYLTKEDRGDGGGPVIESEGSLVSYDDASILKSIRAIFAPQVVGTLSKGDTSYLQLKGGGLLKEGDSFPGGIPQVEDKSFTVQVLEITTRGYKLKMNDVVQEVTFEKTSGIIKDSAK